MFAAGAISHIAIVNNGICSTKSTSATANDVICERSSKSTHSSSFFCPKACAVSPPVPKRRNENIQYIILNSIAPTAMAAI